MLHYHRPHATPGWVRPGDPTATETRFSSQTPAIAHFWLQCDNTLRFIIAHHDFNKTYIRGLVLAHKQLRCILLNKCEVRLASFDVDFNKKRSAKNQSLVQSAVKNSEPCLEIFCDVLHTICRVPVAN
jgi:hypothetical protein